MKRHSYRRLALATAMFATFSLSACNGVDRYTAEQYIQRARDFEGKGDIEAAVIELKNALQSNPNNPQARLLLGQIYLKGEEGEEAEREIRKAAEFGVGDEVVKPLLGRALLLQQEFQHVLDEIHPSTQMSSAITAKILQMRGEALQGLGHFKDGCSNYQHALRLDKHHVPTYWGLAKCAAAEKDLAGAHSYLSQATQINASESFTWVLLGDLARVENKQKEAESAYRKAIETNPVEPSGHLALASLYLSTNNFEAARIEANAVLKSKPNNLLALHSLAMVNYREGKLKEAKDILARILSGAPDYLPSVLLAGAVNHGLGNFELARAQLGKVLGQVPRNVLARKLLASVQLKTGEPQQALETLKPLLDSSSADIELLNLAGEAFLQNRDFAGAAAYFEQASAIKPSDVRVKTGLAVSKLGLGDTDRALAELLEAASASPTVVKADMVLFLNHFGRRDFDKALQAITAMEKKDPSNPHTLNWKGLTYLSKKDPANARRSFERALAAQPTYLPAANNLAQMDLWDKKPQAARRRFDEVLRKDKDNVGALVALARLSTAPGQEKEFVALLTRAIKAAPTAYQPRDMLARFYIGKKEPQKALALAQELQAALPKDIFALNLLGMCQAAAGEKENALSTFTRLAQLAPNAPTAHYYLGIQQRDTDRKAAARSSFAKSLQLQPGYLPAQEALIALEIADGHHPKALQLAQEIQRQRPREPVGFVREGDIHMVSKRYGQAASMYARATGLSKSSSLMIKWHSADSLSGNGKAADARLLQWLTEHPRDLPVRLYLAEYYLGSGRNREAIAQYEVALTQSPRNAVTLNNLAWAYYQEKDRRALPTAEKAHELAPQNAGILDTLGWITLELGDDAPRAGKLLAEAVKKAPSSPSVRYHYGVALATLGNHAAARKELQRAVSSSAAFPEKAQAEAMMARLP